MAVQLVDVPVKCTKEARDISKAVLTIIKAAKQAGADGFQAGQDLSEVSLKSWADLVEAIKGMQLLGDEATAEPAAFTAAFLVDIPEIVTVLTKPDAPVQAQEAPAAEAAAPAAEAPQA